MTSSAGSFGGRVYAAVAAGQSAEEVRRAIDACALPGDERGRAAAVNKSGGRKDNAETALQAAHRLRRGDLVGLLLEEGADASMRRPTTALAMCVCYDLPETLRALLRKGGHDANQRLKYYNYDLPAASDGGCTLAHVCVGPPQLAALLALPPPRLACLDALVHQGGVSVDVRDQQGKTPLHWAAFRTGNDGAAVVDLLVCLGADVNAGDEDGRTPIFGCIESRRDDIAMLRRLLAHGASPDVFNNQGHTPLMDACSRLSMRDVALELARRSSPETRRADVSCRGSFDDGFSAIDFIARARSWTNLPWQKELIAVLLNSGVSVLPQHASVVLPVAVSHVLPPAAQMEAVRPAELCTTSWRAQEAFSGLAMDVGELRAAESEVEAKRRRVMELEQELAGSGVGMESSSSGGEEGESDEDNESESGSEDEEEAGIAPSGGGGE